MIANTLYDRTLCKPIKRNNIDGRQIWCICYRHSKYENYKHVVLTFIGM